MKRAAIYLRVSTVDQHPETQLYDLRNLASQRGFAVVHRAHLSRILNSRAGVSAAMSLRLSAALGTSPDFWLKMQMQYDLWQAQKVKQPKIRPFPHVAKNKELALA